MRIRFLTVVFLCVGVFTAYASEKDSLGTAGPVTLVKIKPAAYKQKPSGVAQTTAAKASNYKRWTGLKYSGYVRSYNQYRNMPERYSGPRELINVNGLDISNGTYTGYQEPLLLLRVEGNPTARTWFQVEYMFDNQMIGKIREDTTAGQHGIASNLNRRAMTYRILQFKAGANTKVGDFTLTAGGGVNWHKMSPFTLWNYEYRDDMFERYPWDPDQQAWNKYNVYYSSQNIARDVRWGNTATQGFIIEGKNMPKGFGFSFLYGKTDNSGGFQTYNTKIPKNLLAGRLEKGIRSHKFGVNYFSQVGFIDGTGFNRIRQQIITTDGRLNFNTFKIFYEAGMGQWQDGLIDKNAYAFLYDKPGKDSIVPTGRDFGWSNGNAWKNNRAISLQFDFTKEATFIPLNLQFFSIGKGVVNVNSQILNSANNHAVGTPANVGSVYDITTFEGAITDIGQMTNNRQGVYLKHEDTYGKLKLMVAYGLSQEIENDTVNSRNMISYWHQSNPFTRSRLTYFQSMTGPYERVTSLFRRTYEKFTITDTIVNYKKSYNTLAVSLKYKINLFKRELILANYNNYNSVSDKLSALPSINFTANANDKAFLRTFYEEFMVFYGIHPKVTLLGTVSYERVWGNNRLNLADASGNEIRATDNKTPIYDPNGRTIDQTGHGYGIGVDYNFASKAGLYIRNRWFDHKDKNFTKDAFRGMETTVELKIFF
jgi:hypothetical protein